MSFGVAEDLSRLFVGLAVDRLADIRLLEGWKGSESDDDFQGDRNWAVLLILLAVPAFVLMMILLAVWLF